MIQGPVRTTPSLVRAHWVYWEGLDPREKIIHALESTLLRILIVDWSW